MLAHLPHFPLKPHSTAHSTVLNLAFTPFVSIARSSCTCLLLAFPDKVNDPMMAAQIAWMMEVPELYRLFYDKPLQLQCLANGYEHPVVLRTKI